MKHLLVLLPQLLTASAAAVGQQSQSSNSTFYNPTIPGWNPDPSCIHVDDDHFQDTFFCATSTFLAVPGLPIYASKDLINWRLASNVWTRESQLPLPNAARDITTLQDGFYAPNLRYKDGTFYMTNLYLGSQEYDGIEGLGTIFTTTDPFNSASWSDALTWNASRIDPELFWDNDGSTYLVSQGIVLQTIDLETGDVSDPVSIWNGTGGPAPEGPHIFFKDDWYYLVIAEFGTGLNHSVTIARSDNLWGPYEDGPDNPYLTAKNTDNFFQIIGHVDLFTDKKGQWWAMGLTTRGGPDWVIHPMGRETFMTPVTWEEGDYPVFDPVFGVMNGWELPPPNRDVAAEGPFVQDPDAIDFAPNSSIPAHFLYFRFPEQGTFTVSPEGHPNSLHIRPARVNLTGVVDSDEPALTGARGIPFVGRRQSHTLFSFAVDLSFSPEQMYQEAGITALLTQHQHADLGIGLSTATPQGHDDPQYDFLFRTTEIGRSTYGVPYNLSESITRIPMPLGWANHDTVTLQLDAANETHYVFSAFPAGNPEALEIIAYAPVTVTSVAYQSGQYLGTLLGIYATCNGAGNNGTRCPTGGDAYFSNWRYDGVAQQIGANEFVDASGAPFSY